MHTSIQIVIALLILTGFASFSRADSTCESTESHFDKLKRIEKARGLKDLSETSEKLKERGVSNKEIDISINDQTYKVLKVEPLKNGPPINRLAFSLQSKFKTSLYYEPLSLTRGMGYQNVGGMFSRNARAIWVGKDVLYSGQPQKDATFKHESFHAQSYHELLSGIDSAYHGVVQVSKKFGYSISKSQQDYWRFFSFEELYALSITLKETALKFQENRPKLLTAKANEHSRDFHEQAFSGFAAARALKNVSQQTIDVIERMRKKSTSGEFEINLHESGKYAEVKFEIPAYDYRDYKFVDGGTEVTLSFPKAHHIQAFKRAIETKDKSGVKEIIEARFKQLEVDAQKRRGIANEAANAYSFGLALIDNKKTDLDLFITTSLKIPL